MTPPRAVAALVLAAPLCGAAAPGTAAEIAISCSALGAELELCRQGAEAWAEQTGNEVAVVSTPNSATERLALYQQILSAQGADIDVYQIDVVWPGILAEHFIDLRPYMQGDESAHFEPLMANATIGGELKAMPWFADAGLLYYRTDLLEAHGLAPPATWAELENAARTVMQAEREAGREGMQGFVFQARAYEGLTVNALEWLHSFGGGTIVDAQGEITVNNPRAVEALETASRWVGGIAPEGVLNYSEEEARGVFQSGAAVFMRNWPYAWALANAGESPVRGKVGVTALPRGGAEGTRTGALGGQMLAVSRYSEHPEAAADLVRHLTSYEEQKRRAVAGAFNPTIAALFEDKELLEAVPFLARLSETFRNAVARPSAVTGEKYNRVSNAFYNAVHRALSGQQPAAEALADLEAELKRIRRRAW